MSQPVRVIVIEQGAVYRRGLVATLSTADDVEITGSTGTAEEAYRLVDETGPDIAVIGTTMTEAPGTALAAEMRRRFPAIATILISPQESDDELFSAIRAGAAAYSNRDVSEEVLFELIRRAARGEYVINEQLLSKPYVAARVLDEFRGNSSFDAALAQTFIPLSDRELAILGKISDGMTNAEIAKSLGLSAQTVKNHVTSILRKLAVNDRTQAVVTAVRRGWLKIEVDDPPEGQPSGLTNIPTSQLGSDRRD